MDRSYRLSIIQAAKHGKLDQLFNLLNDKNFDKALLYSNASISISPEPNMSSNTPFSVAAGYGHLNVVRWIAVFYAKVTSLQAGSPLHRACSGGQVECVRYLVEGFPRYVNEADHKGRFPIQFAAYGEHFEIVQILLRSDADADLGVEYRFRGELPRMLHYSKAFTFPALLLVSINGNLQIANLLLQYKVNPFTIIELSPNGVVSALSLAAGYKNLEVLKRLCSVVPIDGKYGYLAVKAAISSKSTNCLEFLLEQGAPRVNTFTKNLQKCMWRNLLQGSENDSDDVIKTLQILFDYETSLESLNMLDSESFSHILIDCHPPTVKFLVQSGIYEMRYHNDRCQMTEDFNYLMSNLPFYDKDIRKPIMSYFPIRAELALDPHREASDASFDVLSLQHICRWTIRSEIAIKHGCILQSHIKQLKLPPALSRYLWLHRLI